MESIEPAGGPRREIARRPGAPFKQSISVILSKTSKTTASIQKDRK